MSSKRLEQLLQFYKDSPEDSFICFALAKEYEQLRRWDEALVHYVRLTQNDPDYVGTYYHLGKLYELLDDEEKAINTYRAGMAVAKKIGDRHALSELAGVLLNLEG